MNSISSWFKPENFKVDIGYHHTLWSSHSMKGFGGICTNNHCLWGSFLNRADSITPFQGSSHAQGFKAEARNDADRTLIRESLPLSVVHKRGDVVAEKYKIVGILGQGGIATTYEAETDSGCKVALKAMSLRNMKGWKDLELFEREARVLRSLRHPGIPEYVDYFEVDSNTDRAFYLVQMVAKGRSLAELVKNGWRATDDEIKRIAIEVLEILHYLGSLRPPVIHRDVKPENIILDEDTGKIKLVDFGAVQDAAAVTLIGSTVVGTYGYMAPEQFQNRATIQSDLFGLGGTILYLVTGRPPSSFPQKRLKIQFQDLVTMDPDLQRFVERLLEPAPEDRFQSAADAIDGLRNNSMYSEENNDAAKKQFYSRQGIRKPVGTKVSLKRTASAISIKIPPVGFTEDSIGSGTFALAWNAFLLFWTRSAVTGGAPLFFTLFSLPFWFVGIRLAKGTLSKHAVSVDMEFGSSKFYIRWSVGNLFQKQIDGQTKDINSVSIVVEGEQNGRVIACCQILEGRKHHKFGSGLEIVELDWLVQQIGEFLELGPPKIGKYVKAKNK